MLGHRVTNLVSGAVRCNGYSSLRDDPHPLPLTHDQRERYSAAAAREGLTLDAWLHAAAELALARGSTR
jgi:hypothetical protein